MFFSGISGFIRSKKIRCSAVVVAGGSAERFGSDKIMAPLMETPVLAYSLMVFNACEYVTEIVVVAAPGKIEEIAELCDDYNIQKVTKVVVGGATRAESALSGVSETSSSSNLIAIHDGARPLVTQEVVKSAIECAFHHKAAVAAVPARDTVKIVPSKTVLSTPKRSQVYSVQTPQVFEPNIIKGALTDALMKELPITDDASAVEALGFNVFLSQGSEENIKLTTPLDMKLAETILLSRRR
ncbi:MAG: 2-C-methyl-D-erythritol 4-phosphate cytidylyltransferase [Clostridiales bacterium]|nr:2-C-methyl-D-erythritol 4-phosphate cytidylyltransferase [Clostridiales bacterium]